MPRRRLVVIVLAVTVVGSAAPVAATPIAPVEPAPAGPGAVEPPGCGLTYHPPVPEVTAVVTAVAPRTLGEPGEPGEPAAGDLALVLASAAGLAGLVCGLLVARRRRRWMTDLVP